LEQCKSVDTLPLPAQRNLVPVSKASSSITVEESMAHKIARATRRKSEPKSFADGMTPQCHPVIVLVLSIYRAQKQLGA